jgi:hypothetical protein
MNFLQVAVWSALALAILAVSFGKRIDEKKASTYAANWGIP